MSTLKGQFVLTPLWMSRVESMMKSRAFRNKWDPHRTGMEGLPLETLWASWIWPLGEI